MLVALFPISGSVGRVVVHSQKQHGRWMKFGPRNPLAAHPVDHQLSAGSRPPNRHWDLGHMQWYVLPPNGSHVVESDFLHVVNSSSSFDSNLNEMGEGVEHMVLTGTGRTVVDLMEARFCACRYVGNLQIKGKLESVIRRCLGNNVKRVIGRRV